MMAIRQDNLVHLFRLSDGHYYKILTRELKRLASSKLFGSRKYISGSGMPFARKDTGKHRNFLVDIELVVGREQSAHQTLNQTQ